MIVSDAIASCSSRAPGDSHQPRNDTRANQPRALAAFIDPWKDRVVDLINELILSYLERVVIPSLSFGTPSLIAEALFGKPTAGKLLNLYCHCCLTQLDPEPTPDFNADYVSRKVSIFWVPNASERNARFDRDFLGRVRVLHV